MLKRFAAAADLAKSDITGSVGLLVAQADIARDAGDWASAEAGYEVALREDPALPDIWVQYGHSLKECAKPEEAEAAYRRAIALRPEDAAESADTWLQLGHALKLQGKLAEALDAYERSALLDPENRFAVLELTALAARVGTAALSFESPVAGFSASAAPASEAVFLDVSDLLDYFRHNRAPTGIQRVQIEVSKALFDRPDVGFCAMTPHSAGWSRLPRRAFETLLKLSASGTRVDDPPWQAAVRRVLGELDAAPAITFPSGAALVNIGTSWWLPNYFGALHEAKLTHGLRYIPFIHDVIPLKVPEHCAQGLVDEFALWFDRVTRYADAVLVNSRHTRQDVIEAFGKAGRDDIAASVCTLNAGVEPAAPATARHRLDIDGAFVLFVGTIESRKDHLLVFDAWLELCRMRGPNAVPTLVCVGKMGWLNHHMLARLTNSDVLKDKVRLLSDIGDGELRLLYERCLFTIYNSYYEGWGLPVSESLSLGKICVTPDNSSLPEAGGGLAVHFGTGDRAGLIRAVSHLLDDPASRESLEARIVAEYRPRGWLDIGDDIYTAASRLGAAPARLPEPPRLASGSLLDFSSRRKRRGRTELSADAAKLPCDWHAPEQWGSWSKTMAARIGLRIDGAIADPLLYLRCQGGPQGCAFRVRIGACRSEAIEVPGSMSNIRLEFDGAGAVSGDLTIVIESGGLVDLGALNDGSDPRRIGIGVESLMLCDRQDASSRLEFLDRYGPSASYTIGTISG